MKVLIEHLFYFSLFLFSCFSLLRSGKLFKYVSFISFNYVLLDTKVDYDSLHVTVLNSRNLVCSVPCCKKIYIVSVGIQTFNLLVEDKYFSQLRAVFKLASKFTI